MRDKNIILPPGWRPGTLGELFASISGGFSVRCENRPAGPEEMAVLKTGAVLGGRFDPSRNKFVPPEQHKSLRTPVRSGTVIFCRKNSEDIVGGSALVKSSEQNIFLSDLLWELKPANDVNEHWLINIMQSERVRSLIRQEATGTQNTMRNISQERLAGIPIVIPSKVDQDRIAEILRAWDEAIEKLTALVEKMEQRQQALTHSLVFGGRQLEFFRSSEPATQYRWFELPASWGSKSIGMIAIEFSERNADGRVNEVLSCSKYRGFVRSLEYFKKQVFSNDLTGYKKIWKGDFGFPSNHVEEGSIGLQNLTEVGVVSPIYTIFRFDPDTIDNDYAFAVLKTSLYRHIFEVSTSASVDRRGSLRWGEFSKIPFPVPPIEEQRAIALVLKTHRKELDAIRSELDAIGRQKRGLMQKLLTGEWRVTP
jgi:type I restriction enzyme, S subunit